MDKNIQIDEIFSDYDFIFTKDLGWYEIGSNGEEVQAMILVLDANFGYNIFRLGERCELLEWIVNREEALEYAIDICRKEISHHEIKEMGRD